MQVLIYQMAELWEMENSYPEKKSLGHAPEVTSLLPGPLPLAKDRNQLQSNAKLRRL